MSKKNSDIDQYQEELNEQVNDGGGCVEMWEAIAGREESDSKVSRRSMLQGVGGTTAGVAVSSLASVFATTTAAADDKSKNIQSIVEDSEVFGDTKEELIKKIEETIDERIDELEDESVELKNEEINIEYKKPDVREVEIDGEKEYTATYSKEKNLADSEIEISSEITVHVVDSTVKQASSLARVWIGKKAPLISVAHDTAEVDKKVLELEEGDLKQEADFVVQQTQCIPCNADLCYDTCVAVWDQVCNSGATDYCGYPTTVACVILAGLQGWITGAVCALFMEAICSGDIGCYDTPENMCEDSANACDDPWLQ